MRKGLCALVALVLALPLCGVAELVAGAPLAEDDFALVLEGETYRLGDAAAPLAAVMEAAMGPVAVTEADSCMFDGQDKEFATGELLMATYPIGPGGADVIETLMVIGGAHETARGIGIGAAKAEVVAAYGEAYALDYDQLIYRQGEGEMAPFIAFVLDLETDTVASFYMMRNTGI